MNQLKKFIVFVWGTAAVLSTGFALSKVAASQYAVHIPVVLFAGGVLAIGGVLSLERLLKVGEHHSEREVPFGFELVDLASNHRSSAHVIIFKAIEVEVWRRDVQGKICALLNFPDPHYSSRHSSFSNFEVTP